MKKNVNGVDVEMTAEEVAETNARYLVEDQRQAARVAERAAKKATRQEKKEASRLGPSTKERLDAICDRLDALES